MISIRFSRRSITALFLILLGCAIFIQGVQNSNRRLFWLDESYVFESVCSETVGSLVVNGSTHECSPAPLFGILLKTTYDITLESPIPIQVKLRLVPILCGVLTAIFFFLMAQPLGGLAAAIGALSLSQQNLFIDRLTESRPYIAWLLGFTLLTGCLSRMGSKAPDKVSKIWLLFLALIGFGLNSTVSPGAVQVVLGITSLALFWIWKGERTKISRTVFLRFLGVGVFAMIPFFLYGIHTCSTQHADVVNSFFRGETWAIFLSVSSILISATTLQSSLQTALLILGLVGPFALKKYLETSKTPLRLLQSFAWALWTQLIGCLILGSILAFRDYYFVPKLFSYLLACRAYGLTLGIVILFEWLGSVTTAKKVRGLGIALLLAVAIHGGRKHILSLKDLEMKTTHSMQENIAPCPEFRGKIAVFEAPSSELSYAHRGMAMAQIERDLHRCGWKPSSETTYVSVTGWKTEWNYTYTTDTAPPPPESQAFRIAGIPYVISSPRWLLDNGLFK